MRHDFPLYLRGAAGSFPAFVLRRFREHISGPALIIVPTEQEAENLLKDLETAGVEAGMFPWWGSVPYRETPSASPVFGRRSHVLAGLLSGERGIVVAPLRAALTPLPPVHDFQSRIQKITLHEELDPLQLGAMLEELGYLRVPRVSVPGEYAVRGEVVDLYLPGSESAVRVLFSFDTIEGIRLFDVESQSSSERLKYVELYPRKEVVWGDDRVSALRSRLEVLEEFKGTASGAPDVSRVDQVCLPLEEGRRLPGEEIYFPLAYESPGLLVDYFGESPAVFFVESERLDAAEGALAKEYSGLFQTERGRRPIPAPERLLVGLDSLRSVRRRVEFVSLGGESQDIINLGAVAPRSFFGNVEFLKEELTSLAESGYQIWVFADSEVQAGRISHLLREFDLRVVPEALSTGFSIPDLFFAVIEEREIFGRRRRLPRSVKKVHSAAIDSFVELSEGDYVVHLNHGIGRFKGIKRIKTGNNERDYIHLEFAGDEFVYVPIEQVNLVQRYIGSEGAPPRLDRIGGTSWEKRKSRVKKSVEDLAERLVKLYSKRRTAKGFAFPTDSEWQVEFEAAFPYEETPDQLSCIADVKSDMERPAPMDRLICGDVGYGKTEVALRAAFKAVSAGKQAALLAPTTILVEQHYENFSDRLDRFPVETAMLSRFIAPSEQKKALAGIADGSVDLVVGTHRLLQRDVKFKDLGLLIVDEEQRFGVKDKERLKELKTSVDCLTLTATPIPRTLHMSLLKIRDMSVLQTPPNNRLPIETVIQEFDEDLVANAVRQEVERGGQVYYLHNRVETLDQVVLFLNRVVPEVLVESAHGQMGASELEDIMHRFIHGGFQVLVATTIIENGIDIPNVNSIIIDRADMYGISQLYQLRGRVGRSDRLAYAYLLYPGEHALTELAMKRLRIISDFTELGSGFKVALKDLEVRGAGNLLGREQSGDILSVGFDLYVKLLDEAIREIESDGEEEPEAETYLELEYSGYIPNAYVADATEKMEVYKKIASISDEKELDLVVSELEDRFGPPPDEVQSLMALAEIRILCKKLHIASLKERRSVVEVEFGKVSAINASRVVELVSSSGGKVRLDPKRPNVLILESDVVGLKEKSEFLLGRLQLLL